MKKPINWDKITRLTIVNHSTPSSQEERWGRVFEKWEICVEPSVQDGGKTLKIFVRDLIQKERKEEREIAQLKQTLAQKGLLF